MVKSSNPVGAPKGTVPWNKGTAKPIELHLCACGECNEMVPGRFKRGHGARVSHWSKGSEAERIKSALSVSASQRTGEKSPRYGKTKETNPAFSNAGRKKGCITWNKGGGEYLGLEARERVKDGSRGKEPWNKDFKDCHPPEVIAKMVHKGKDNFWYVDGRSCETGYYPGEWTEGLREMIRERDGRECKICFIAEKDCEVRLCVHHIDYDRKNLGQDNLISLCVNCHAKTNSHRSEWTSFFKTLLNDRQVSHWIFKIDPSIIGSGYIREQKLFNIEATQTMHAQ